jgi:hypothetical protein
MNITGEELLRQYKRAWARCGDVIDRAEAEIGCPPFMLYAVGSRETNWDPFWETRPGDGGNGHGYLQVDKRFHRIPDDWTTNLEWQVRKGAEILQGCFERFQDWEAAANAYNSGRPNASATTGGDYGPDVMARRAWLAGHVERAAPFRLKPEERDALLFTRSLLQELKDGGWFVGEIRDRLSRVEARVAALQGGTSDA